MKIRKTLRGMTLAQKREFWADSAGKTETRYRVETYAANDGNTEGYRLRMNNLREENDNEV